MKIKANKILAVLCVIAMVMTMIVPMTMTAAAETVTETISFASTAQRQSQTTTQQVWKNGDVTFTNDKASSSSNVANYSNPVRLYANSSITISAPGSISMIVFTCSSSSYATALKNSIGASATASGSTVTVNNLSGTTFTVAKITAQVRMTKLEVTYAQGGAVDPDVPVCEHENTTVLPAKPATCTEMGLTEGAVCANPDCGEILTAQNEQPFIDHDYDNGICSMCGRGALNGVVFEFGANGSASHADGASKTTYTETNGNYTLNLTDGSSMYTGARDEKGNSCIKLGKSDTIGGFNIVVPDNVISVIIYAAQYKTKDSTLKINESTYAITAEYQSSNGKYMPITVDTSINKTVTVETISGSERCMIDAIAFVIGEVDPSCQHTTTEVIPAVEPTCTKPGSTAGEKCSVCDAIITEPEELPATGVHEYVDGVCACGDIEDGVEELTIAQAITVGKSKGHDTYTEDKYYVTGVIAEVYHTTYGNMRIKDENGNILTIYGTYINEGATRYDSMAYKPQAGDTVTIWGVVGQYNGTAQIKNGWITEIGNIDALDAVNAYMTLAYKYAEDGGQLVDSMFVLKCGVDATLENIEGADSYGIRVTAGGKTVDYTSLTVGDDGKIYVAINLGDIINVDAKLTTDFTVCAFVEANGVKVVSTSTKTYSVAGMVDEYHTQGIEEVEHLYNVLNERGLV